MTIEELAAGVASVPDVRAVLLIGSQARSEVPADEWSDVDLAVFADDPRAVLDDLTWVHRLGEPDLTFVEETAVGGQLERRVLFADGTEVDFAVFPATAVDWLLTDPEADAVLGRGYRILHDELALAERLAAHAPRAAPAPRDLVALANDFWYHAIWTAKKLRRGEYVTARNCLEGRLKSLLLALARERSSAADTWHRDRFVETWADGGTLAACWEATASDPSQLPAALRRVCDAFDELSDFDSTRARRRLDMLLP